MTLRNVVQSMVNQEFRRMMRYRMDQIRSPPAYQTSVYARATPRRATRPKRPACMPIAVAALLLDGLVEVSEEDGLRLPELELAWLEVVEGGTDNEPGVELADELELELVEPDELDEPWLIVKSSDWARMPPSWVADATKLIWKPDPVGQPPLGAPTLTVPSLD